MICAHGPFIGSLPADRKWGSSGQRAPNQHVAAQGKLQGVSLNKALSMRLKADRTCWSSSKGAICCPTRMTAACSAVCVNGGGGGGGLGGLGGGLGGGGGGGGGGLGGGGGGLGGGGGGLGGGGALTFAVMRKGSGENRGVASGGTAAGPAHADTGTGFRPAHVTPDKVTTREGKSIDGSYECQSMYKLKCAKLYRSFIGGRPSRLLVQRNAFGAMDRRLAACCECVGPDVCGSINRSSGRQLYLAPAPRSVRVPPRAPPRVPRPAQGPQPEPPRWSAPRLEQGLHSQHTVITSSPVASIAPRLQHHPVQHCVGGIGAAKLRANGAPQSLVMARQGASSKSRASGGMSMCENRIQAHTPGDGLPFFPPKRSEKKSPTSPKKLSFFSIFSVLASAPEGATSSSSSAAASTKDCSEEPLEARRGPLRPLWRG